MRQHPHQQQPHGHAQSGSTPLHTPSGGANFQIFRAPGAQYPDGGGLTEAPYPGQYPSQGQVQGSHQGSGRGVPMTVGPPRRDLGYPERYDDGHLHQSHSSASSPYRTSGHEGSVDPYEGLDGHSFEDMEDMDGGMSWMRTGRVVRVKETGQSFRFPLDEDQLPRITLSRAEVATLQDAMEQAVDRATRLGTVSWMENPTKAPVNAKEQWKVHVEKKNGVMYRRKNDTAMARHFLFRSKVDCSMNDVMYGVLSDNTEDERTYLAHVYRDDFLDGAVLQLLARPNVEDPYQLFAVKWAAFQSPVDSMYSIRDQVYVEYSRTVTDAKGQSVVARVFQSINTKNYAAEEPEFGFVRNEISWTQLLRVVPGSKDTKVDMTMAGSFGFPNTTTTPSWLANRFLSSMQSVMTSVAHAGDAKFIVNASRMSDKPWVPNHERSACSVCLKSFGLLRHRHHCRICAEIMCSTCTLELALRTSRLPSNLRPDGGLISAEKFCFKCVEQGRRDRGNTLAQAHAATAAAAAANRGYDLAATYEESNKENQGRHSESFAAYVSERAYQKQEQHDYQARTLTPTAHSHGLAGYQGDQRALTAAHHGGYPRGGPLHAPGYQQQGSGGMERMRSDGAVPDRSGALLRSTGSLPTQFVPDSVGTDVTELGVRDSEDAVNITPIPSSFARMEQSIAAQQVLLRNMAMEGQKMMRHPQQQQQQQQYYESGSGRGRNGGAPAQIEYEDPRAGPPSQ